MKTEKTVSTVKTKQQTSNLNNIIVQEYINTFKDMQSLKCADCVRNLKGFRNRIPKKNLLLEKPKMLET